MHSIQKLAFLALATYASAQLAEAGDGQVQQPSSVTPIAQITDGQVQQQTSVVTPIAQISDGQVQQQTTAVVTPISQIADGQVQQQASASASPSPSANGTSVVSPSPSAFLGAAGIMSYSLELVLLAVGAGVAFVGL